MSDYKSRIIKYDNKYRVDYSYKTPEGVYKHSCKRGFSLMREATNWQKNELPKLIIKLEQGEPLTRKRSKEESDDKEMLFSELVESYMKRSELRRKKTTCGTKENIIKNRILPFFADKKLFQITVKDIEEWQDNLLQSKTTKGTSLSPTYIRTIRSQFTAIMNYAVRLYGLPYNPLDRAEMIGSKQAEERLYWTLEQYKQFRGVIAEKPEYFYAFEVLFWTGMRMGEMLALKLNDIDFDKLTITVDETYTRLNGEEVITSPKTKDSRRTIYIPKTLGDELQEYVAGIYGLKKDSRIFHVTKSGLHREIDRGVKLCSLPDICVHGLRHSCSSFLQSEELKTPEVVVSAILGHSRSHSMTGRYSHAYEKDLIAVAERLNAIMEEMENVKKEP